MPARTDSFDLGQLLLRSGEARRLELDVTLGDFRFGTDRYVTEPPAATATLDISRMTGNGFALRLRFAARLAGPCMRCLEDAAPEIEVDAREVDQPGDVEELSSPYVRGGELDVARWAHDSLALAIPVQVLCRTDCAGLCPTCGANLNDAPDHAHEPAPDPRWAKLAELRLDEPPQST